MGFTFSGESKVFEKSDEIYNTWRQVWPTCVSEYGQNHGGYVKRNGLSFWHAFFYICADINLWRKF